LPEKKIKELSKFSLEKKEIEVNLDEQKITKGDNEPIEFEVEPFRKECLINGYDDIALTLKKQNHIDNFIEKQKSKTPWHF
jgi:3-isopropylmalate/(R)-2-methylmalate dehydratase small subunit